MKAKIEFDENNYIKRFITDYINGNYEVDDDFEFDYLFCYHLVNGKIVLDKKKKAEQQKQEEAEALKPTWQETIESQVFYTAMETGTLIE